MNSRFTAFSKAFRSWGTWREGLRSDSRPRIAQFVCQSCRHKFSTSSLYHKITRGTRRRFATATKNVQENKYSTELMVYDAGETRTTFIAFWKALALLQCGTCIVLITPKLYKNENQPSEFIRTSQAVGVSLASALPSLILSYVTAPYVNQVYIQIPPHATQSLIHLRAFARNLPGSTRVRFLTLRIFPIGKFTTTYLSELRALPPKGLRFANIVLPKTDAWRRRQAEKSLGRKLWEFVQEPRFKFYVKEGKTYTIRSGVPGVWEQVAKRIQEQTVAEMEAEAWRKAAGRTRVRGILGAAKPSKAEREQVVPPIKRQTTRG